MEFKDIKVPKLGKEESKLLKALNQEEQDIHQTLAQFHARQVEFWKRLRAMYNLPPGNLHSIRDNVIYTQELT